MTRKPLASLLFLLSLLAATAAPARAQSAVDMLTAAAKLMEKGDHAGAVVKLGEAFGSGKLDSGNAAKAFLLRGEANEKLGQQALALADYTNAIFMQGLSPADRAKAAAGIKRAQAALGIASDAPVIPGARKDEAAPVETSQKKDEPAGSSGGGGGGFFANWFGGGEKPKPAEDAPDWAAGTRVSPVPPAAAPPPSPQQQAAAPPGPIAGDDKGQYTIQLARVASEEDAQSEAKRLASRLGELLDGRVPEVTRIEKDASVTFLVAAGPYEGRLRSQEICEGMKARGVRCLVVSR